MKKFLSVMLALAMTLSLVVVGASAKDFTDKSKITYSEAVNTLTGIGVIDGYTDGSFNPSATLTRGAAAKIICNMVLGPTTAAALGVSAAPFKDVSTSNVFAGYIAYCAKQGIINGYADKTFRPSGTVTGYQFLKMLLGALGYDSTIEGFTGDNWEVNVAKLASNLGLYSGNSKFVGTQAMTREEACLYAFNTLRATMVDYETKGQTITINGVTIAQGASKAAAVKAGPGTTYADKNSNSTLEFYEKYFSDMTIDTNSYAQGLVNRTISYGGKTISNSGSVGKVLATSTDGTAYADLTTKSNSSYIGYAADSTLTYVYNDTVKTAALTSANDDSIGIKATNAGLWQDKATDVDLAALTGTVVKFIDTDGNGKYDTVTYVQKSVQELAAAPTIKTSGSLTTVKIGTLSATDKDSIVYPDGLVKGDVILSYVSGNGTTYVEKATKVDGDKITAYSAYGLTINGKTYYVSDATGVNMSLAALKATIGVAGYTYYLDANGYICYTDAPSTTANLTNTLLVTATDKTTSFGSSTYKAKAVYTDGKTDTLTVSKVKNSTTMTDVNAVATAASSTDGTLASGTFYTFVKNSDGSVNLTKAANQQAALTTVADATNNYLAISDTSYAVTAKTTKFLSMKTVSAVPSSTTTAWSSATVTSADQPIYGTNSTVFMYKDSSTGAYNVYTGINSALNYAAGGSIYVLMDSTNTYALAVICMGGNTSTAVSSYDKVFVNGAATTSLDADNVPVYTYTATINGATGKSISSYVALTKGTLYFVKDYNKTGVVTAATASDAMASTVAVTDADVQAVTYNNGVMMVDGTAYLLGSDAKVYLYDGSSASIITPEQATTLGYNASASSPNTDSVTVVKTSTSDQSISAVYIYVH